MSHRRSIPPPPPAKKILLRKHEDGRHRHYKYTARAVQRPGDQLITFHLATPQASGLPTARDGSGVYRAVPLGLSARPVKGATGHYSLEVSIAFKTDHHQLASDVHQPFVDDATFKQIKDKFDSFRKRVSEHYPYFTTVPHIRQTKIVGGQLNYELILPPYTGFFTDDPLFWEALRFPSELVEHHSYATAGGARTGIKNKTPEVFVVNADYFQDTEEPAFSYKVLNKRLPPEKKRLRLQVEFFVDWLPQTLSEAKPLNKETAGEALSKLLYAGLLVLNLDPESVLALEASAGRILIKSKKFGGVTGQLMNVSIRLSASLTDFFVLDDATLVLPSNDPRNISLRYREPAAEDPLAGLYPVHLVASGQSGAHHFVHGLGWVKVVGLLAGPTKFAGKNDWIELRTGQNELHMQLLDRWCKPVLSAVPTEFMIYLELVEPIF